jgi:beta-glucanase (GH16 family)
VTYYNYLGEPMPESAAAASQLTAPSNNGGQTLTAPGGPSSVDPGTGAGDLMIGSSGDNTFYIRYPSDQIQVADGLSGIKSAIAYTSFDLPANVQNLDSTGSYNFAVGNSLGNLIVAHSDHESLFGDGGADVLVGAGNGTQYIVATNQGSDVIYNFSPADNVRLIGSGYTTFAQVQAAMRQQGSDVVLQVDPNDTLTFRDMSVAQFQASNFLLPMNAAKLGPLTFDDEFNSVSLWNPQAQTGQWLPDYGSDPTQHADFALPQNGDQQVYTTPAFTGTGTQPLGFNPFSVTNGVLSITAQPIPAQEQATAFGAAYSSGMLDTRYLFSQKYGYFEVRMALPAASGVWPAFWMVPDPNPNAVEADIGENTSIQPQIDHLRAWDAGAAPGWDDALKTGDPTGFHTYGMLWTAQTVTWYYDGTAIYQAPTPADWHQPMHMLLNLAIGSYGGDPDPSQYPASLQVDYVRAYALADGSSVVERSMPPTFGTAGDDHLAAPAAGGETLYGLAGADTLTASAGGNTLFGGDGGDSIVGGTGFDQINGDKGDDTIVGRSASGDWLVGGQGADSIDAGASTGANIINGSLGDDTLHAGGGADSLRGGQGDDLIIAGPGNDWLSGDIGNDTLVGGAGADTFHAAAGATTLVENFHAGDHVQLDAGTQYAAAQSGGDVVVSLVGGGEIVLQNAQLSSLASGWLVVV